MLPRVVFPGLTGALVFGAQVLDEKTTVPLFTTISVFVSMLIFTWTTARKLQVFIDRLEKVEGHDKGIRADIEELRASVAGLKLEVREMRDERANDMDHLRSQLKAGSLMEPLSERSGLRVLIVDDSDNDVALMKRKLEPSFIVDSAGKLADANRKLRHGSYDCVLLDLKLPDSHSVKHTVEEFVADNPGILCIVLTGSIDEREHETLIDQGADDVWIKGKDDTDLRLIGRRLREAIWRWRRQKTR